MKMIEKVGSDNSSKGTKVYIHGYSREKVYEAKSKLIDLLNQLCKM
jgi:hypothetical protein